MNVARRLKNKLIQYIEPLKPADDIIVIDGKNLDEATLPVIAIEISSESAHSYALWNVLNCRVSILYRVHAGDVDQSTLDDHLDVLEGLFESPEIIISLSDESDLTIFNWLYQGSVQEWNDSSIDTIFTAECVVTRKPVN
tara:strand:- start:505 stop:924 length:420 start_codon:yes stop_codon:yes gene_type:complete